MVMLKNLARNIFMMNVRVNIVPIEKNCRATSYPFVVETKRDKSSQANLTCRGVYCIVTGEL